MKGKDGNLLWNEMNIKYVKDENGCIIWVNVSWKCYVFMLKNGIC